MTKIGVAISGGGYRASAWGLGVVCYLAPAPRAALTDRDVTRSADAEF